MLFGGELEAGPKQNGGYRVAARIPVKGHHDPIRVLVADDQALVGTGFG